MWTPRARCGGLRRPEHANPCGMSTRYKGRITEWRDERGFGFVTPMEGGERVFIHIKSFVSRARRPVGNELVTYAVKKDANGRRQGIDVRFSGDQARPVSKPGPSASSLLFAAVFVGFVAAAVMIGRLPLVALGAYVVAAPITFLVYARDKAAAQNNRWRTPEAHLHLLALIGGWPGALLAQRVLRHKSSKQPFRAVFWATVALNSAVLVWVVYDPGALERLVAFG
jgi:uncharacterized membrane protein YsdA (DUF1294 family)/cold shock CspA family protein